MTFVVSALVGEKADVVCPKPNTVDAAHWKPSREALATIQGADLIVYNGARWEAWMQTASLPRSRLLDTTRDLQEPFLQREAVTHAHGGGQPHTHSARDGHTWIDPRTFKQQVAEAAKALRARLSDPDITTRQRALEQSLDTLDTAYRALGAAPGDVIIAAQPSYGYLARRYGWTVVNVAMDPTQPATGAQGDALEAVLEGRTAKVMLWPQAPRDVKALSRFGLRHAVVRLANRPSDGETVLGIMQANVEALREAFEE